MNNVLYRVILFCTNTMYISMNHYGYISALETKLVPKYLAEYLTQSHFDFGILLGRTR